MAFSGAKSALSLRREENNTLVSCLTGGLTATMSGKNKQTDKRNKLQNKKREK